MTPKQLVRSILRKRVLVLDELLSQLSPRRQGEHQRAHPYRRMGYFAARRRG